MLIDCHVHLRLLKLLFEVPQLTPELPGEELELKLDIILMMLVSLADCFFVVVYRQLRCVNVEPSIYKGRVSSTGEHSCDGCTPSKKGNKNHGIELAESTRLCPTQCSNTSKKE